MEYNDERPHEAIGQRPPAGLYVPSPRPYPLIVPEMTYPQTDVIRQVYAQGDIVWNSRHLYLSETLAGEQVSVRQTSDRLWDIYFGPIKLAQLDTHDYRLIHLPRRRKKSNEEKKE
ncbi:MAG: hypothetical protein AB1744_13885 [Candidatus Zixiibacteriota bacterium]